jgi:two-component system, cell cycle sensor histidine kinase and response regulator CckA
MNVQSHPIRVLLTDDDEDDFIVVRDLLSDLSPIEFDLEWVSDYGAALDAILSGGFDVCLLDYRLKERNGLELMQEALSRGAMTPIVFLTGHGGCDLDLEAMSKGATDWLTKGELSAALLERSIRQAMERQRKREELIKAKRVIQALSECNHAVIHIKDELELLREICHIVVGVGGYRMAWVGYAKGNPDQTVTPVAQYGYEKEYLETVKVTWQDAERGKGPTGTCIRTGFPCIIRSVGNQAEFVPWKAEALKRGYASVIGLPLLLDGRRLGALTIYSSETDAFDTEEVEFLVKLSGNLSYGIGVLRLRKAQMQAEESLKEANLDLERRVEERTAELVKVNAELRKEVEERRQAEDALGFSETRLRRAEVVARFGNWEFILGRDKVKASEGARIIYGFEGGEWSIAEVQRIPLPEYRGLLDKALNGLIEEGKPYNVEFKIRRPTDGKIIDIHSIAEYSHEKGVVFGVIQDITERKRAEEELRESEELYRTLVSLSPDPISVADLNGLLTFTSPKTMQMFGQWPDEVILGRSLLSWVAPEEQEKASTNIRLLLTEGTLTAAEYTLIKSDGTRFIGEVNAAVIRSPDGSPMNMIFITRDITERKRVEKALLETTGTLQTLIQSSPVAIIVLHPDGNVKLWNPAAERLFGWRETEVLGQFLPYVSDDKREEHNTLRERVLRGESFTGVEVRRRKRDGSQVDISVSTAPMRDSEGNITGIISINIDITQSKRVKEEKEKLEAQLFQAQKMESVGRLAGGVAHDFNNMLGVIIGRAELALNTDVSADQLQHNLKEILKAGLRSADLTRQLLAFARKQTAAPKILDLNDTISGILKMLRRLIGEDIDLFWAPELDLWKIKIDPSQVDQILANLVVNARDAISGVGAITMRTENVVIDDSNRAETPEFIPGEYVLLTVSDTGAGMSQEVRENIFEPFFTTKEVGKGTGLGLSTVYGIVKQNDGFIYVASEPGKGTTFKIYLPLFEAETAQVPSEEITVKRPTGTETILLVEDDEAILNIGKMILENLGYTVFTAQTPVDAIRLAEEHPGDIHLLITDVVMPQMHGRELAEKLSAIRPYLKCLYMSGYTADVIAHRGILDEGLNFIQKPFLSDDFSARVRQVLEHLE